MQVSSKTLSLYLLDRAGFRCEYCRAPLTPETAHYFESDHVFPRSRGGVDDAHNRAVACSSCNRKKSNVTQHADPKSGVMAEVYNPRIHDWSKHFENSKISGVIIGRTPTGRATVQLLCLDQKLDPLTYFQKDGDLWNLSRFGEKIEPDRQFLLDQVCLVRSYRLNCDFDFAITLGQQLLGNEALLHSRIRPLIELAIKNQLLECYYTRSSNEGDLLTALSFVQSMRSQFAHRLHSAVLPRFDDHELTVRLQLASFRSSLFGGDGIAGKSKIVSSHRDHLCVAAAFAQLGRPLKGERLAASKMQLLKMPQLKESNPKQYIRSAMYLAELLVPPRRLILGRNADAAIGYILDAVSFTTTHYGFDIALVVSLQRKVLAMELPTETAGSVMSVSELIKVSKQYKLHNEIRKLTRIAEYHKSQWGK